MNLKSIKLAGFKSFVDPTVIPIITHLTGIVGPNGCGKSNVVDAIRWVIGETSAKQLRGQSMADVIFNGSSARKPVGLASVELVFDNSEGRISGEFAKYSEISIRREVQREGQSQYFLNGVSCRRRDIIDIFLGTGLGPRSYAIIEQGVISELIEAKPEELRAHLEEVSGISKYKERRRETENRMHHTQENLDRINDLNDELTKQLRHLKRQAEAAERYTELKQQERRLQAEIKVMQWQSLKGKLSTMDNQLQQFQLQQDKSMAELRELEMLMEKQRTQHHELNSKREEIRKNFYGLGAEVTGLEQRISHGQEQILRWRKELTEVESAHQELLEHLEEQEDTIQTLNQELTELQPEAVLAQSAAQRAAQNLQSAEQQMQQWQRRWDDFQNESSKFTAQTAALKTNSQHYQQQLANLQQRKNQLLERQNQLPMTDLSEQIETLSAVSEQQKEELAEMEKALARVAETIRDQRQQNNQSQQSLNQARTQIHNIQKRYSSLEAVQRTALGYHNDHTKNWVNERGLKDHPRLGQVLQVNPEWEAAFETVLGGYFDAICLEDIQIAVEGLPSITAGRLTLLGKPTFPIKSTQSSLPLELLSDQIQGQWPIPDWLAGVYVCANLSQALQFREHLTDMQSIITRDGIWIGKHWARVNKAVNQDSGILQREKDLKQLFQEIIHQQNEVEILQARLEEGEQTLHALEEKRENWHKEYQIISSRLRDSQTQLSSRQSRLNEFQQQQQRLQKESLECEQSLQNLETVYQQNQQQLQQSQQIELEYTEKRTQLTQERDKLRAEFENIRNQTSQLRRTADELSVRIASGESQLSLLKQSSIRDRRQCDVLEEKQRTLIDYLEKNIEPLETWRIELQEKLTQRQYIEKNLQEVEQILNTITQDLEKSTRSLQEVQKQIVEWKDQIQNLQMENQAIAVRQTTIQEQLQEQNWVLEELCQSLNPEATLEEWAKHLDSIATKLQRLGAINLAAIDEYQVVNERKTYLDKQQADLNEALDILKNAIQKIDKETRTKFAETFTKVNENFQELFPRIFGGGKACLELLEEDYLTTGVLVKAQPPGKRNASIYMLSGGEKALTAVALVFAMFRLNPAPFCVLDEVDAPLDDMNTGRFCQLVKEMAKTTQFIVISHNKVTISMSERLMGVTMQEAGVSRIVSVNVAEAVALAEA